MEKGLGFGVQGLRVLGLGLTLELGTYGATDFNFKSPTPKSEA